MWLPSAKAVARSRCYNPLILSLSKGEQSNGDPTSEHYERH